MSRISSVFLNRRDYDSSSRTNYQKCTLGSARNLISSPRYYFSVAAKQYLEDVSLGVGGFSICLLVEKKGGGGGGRPRNARKEGSVLLHWGGGQGRKGRRARSGASSPHPPREIIDSQRGNDVVNTTSLAHPLEPAPFFSPTLNPLPLPPLLPGATFLRCFFSLNPPLFPSRLRFLCPSCTLLQLIRHVFLLLRCYFFISFIFDDVYRFVVKMEWLEK